MARTLPGPRSLLITLDAYGTLYQPRHSIANQYLHLAKESGLQCNTSPEHFSQYFNRAFKAQSASHPNYGKAIGMTPETWWATVISEAFRPLLQPGHELPKPLTGMLLRRFSGSEAYELFSDTKEFFQQIRSWRQGENPHVGPSQLVVGVLSNSDPRITQVLRGLGLTIGKDSGEEPADIDFVLTSYELGHEKPSSVAFAKAEGVARNILAQYPSHNHLTVKSPSIDIKVHIGDHPHQDYHGALGCGRNWKAYLLDRDSKQSEASINTHILSSLTAVPVALATLLSSPKASTGQLN